MMTKRQAARFYLEVGKRIRIRRQRAGLSQQQLGKVVGVSGSQIARYERGQQALTVCRVLAIADALQTTAGRLLAKPERRKAKQEAA
jgi:transcriptional regulator with XRE-family HTH domain